jgi:hypothetical protein
LAYSLNLKSEQRRVASLYIFSLRISSNQKIHILLSVLLTQVSEFLKIEGKKWKKWKDKSRRDWWALTIYKYCLWAIFRFFFTDRVLHFVYWLIGWAFFLFLIVNAQPVNTCLIFLSFKYFILYAISPLILENTNNTITAKNSTRHYFFLAKNSINFFL